MIYLSVCYISTASGLPPPPPLSPSFSFLTPPPRTPPPTTTVDYLHKKGLQLTNIGSSDIVDGNSKLLLGLMWTIILRFAIAEDGKQGEYRKEGREKALVVRIRSCLCRVGV